MSIDEFEAVRQLFADEGRPDAESWAMMRSRLALARSNGDVSSSLRRCRRDVIALRYRRPLVLVTISLVTLATIAVASLAATRLTASHRIAPTHGQTAQGDRWPRAVAPTAPSGLQLVSSGGLQIAVPRSWHLNAQKCGTPLADTVLVGDLPVPLCLVTEPPGLTVVDFTAVPLGWDKAAKHGVKVGDTSGQEGWVSASGHNPRLLVLAVPGLPRAVTIQSPSTRTAEQLMATVRVVAADANGCLSHVRQLEPGPSARAGLDDSLVPGRPTTASICSYDGDWLSTSVRQPKASLASLVALLNGLPEGTDQLRNAGNFRSMSNCASLAEQFFVLRFSYASGPPDLVYVHFDGCAPLPASIPPPILNLSASNGVRNSRLDQALVTAVHDLFPVPSGWSRSPG